MPSIIRVSDYSGFKNYKDRWEELLSRSHADNIFLTYEWIDACIRHFCSKEKLLVLNIYNGDRLAGIAPLMIRRHKYFGLPVRSVCFIGTGISDRMDFILYQDKEEIVTVAMDYLMGIKSEWDFINLEEMPEKSGTFEAIRKYLIQKRVTSFFGPKKKSFYIVTGKDKGALSSDFSKKFSRKFKKVANKYGDLKLGFERHIGIGMPQDSIFPELEAIENRSWKGDERSGIFSRPDSAGFHKDILNKFSKSGFLDLSLLILDSRPIAYMYNYIYSKRSYNYSIAHDKRYCTISPGTLLMLWTISDSQSRGIEEFDFTRGEDDWKTRFTSDFRMHERARVFKDSLYSRVLYFLQARIMPYMKNKKLLYNLWMNLKRRLGWV